MSTVVEILSSAGAKVIAFDIGFLEPDDTSRATWIEEFARAAQREGLGSEGLAQQGYRRERENPPGRRGQKNQFQLPQRMRDAVWCG